jgi:hypothetical protein
LKVTWRSVLRAILFVMFVSFILSIGLYVCANFFDWKISWLGNPPVEKKSIYIPLTYPPTLNAYKFSTETGSIVPIVTFEITLEYNDTIIERNPVKMKVHGDIQPMGKDIGYVSVGFEGALTYRENRSSIIYEMPPVFHFDDTTKIITWEVQGDYYPYVIIYFENSSSIIHHYQDYKLHVSSIQEANQERHDRINIALGMSLFLFTIITGLGFLKYFLPKKWLVTLYGDSNTNQNDSTKTKREPPKWKASKYERKKPSKKVKKKKKT